MNIIKKGRWRIMEFLLNTEKLTSKQSNQRKIEETLFVNRRILFKRKVKKFISYC